MTAERRNLYDTAVIGLGPGGLATAGRLSKEDPNHRMIGLDSGFLKEQRVCPALEQERYCDGCGGKCRIIEGIGGACSAVSCGILSEHPAGSGLLELRSPEQIIQVEKMILSWLSEVTGLSFQTRIPHLNQERVHKAQSRGFEVKTYPSSEVKDGSLPQLMYGLFQHLFENDRFHARFFTKVVDIVEKSGTFYLRTDKNEMIEAKNVVIATGRAGNSSMFNLVSNMGASINRVAGYLGIRFETNQTQQLVRLKKEVLDPKFKKDQTRVFCFCPEGKIVGMRVPDKHAGKHIDTLEGCVWPGSDRGNFSVQTRTEFTDQMSYQEWMNQFLQTYLEMSGARVINQSFSSFRDNQAPQLGHSSIAADRVHPGSIRQLMGDNLSDRWLNFLVDLNEVFDEPIITPESSVYGPEVHLWPSFDLDQNMQTSVDGLYVVGDFSGIARGILQAMNMGQFASEGILR